jgi:hypothetical protein
MRPQGKEKVLKLESGSMGLRCVKNPLLKKLWNCRKTNYEIVIDVATIVASISQVHARAIVLLPSSLNEKYTFWWLLMV